MALHVCPSLVNALGICPDFIGSDPPFYVHKSESIKSTLVARYPTWYQE